MEVAQLSETPAHLGGRERARLLIAVEHARTRDSIGPALARAGGAYVLVGHAVSADEAHEMTQALRPDLLMLDLSLPNCDWLETTRRLHTRCPAMQILLLTPQDSYPYLCPALRAGAVGVMARANVAQDLVPALEAVRQGGVYLTPVLSGLLVQEYLQLCRAESGARIQSEPPLDADNPLSPREVEVLTLVTEGLTNRKIAERLCISVKTVETHRGHLLEKLGLHDRVGLVRYAFEKGLIHSESVSA